jgi:hypothetical protein
MFPYLEHVENTSDLESQPQPPALLRKKTYTSTGAPLHDYIAEIWELDAHSYVEINQHHNPYCPYTTREEYKYIQCGITKKGMKTYYEKVLKAENTTLRFPCFKNGDGVQKLADTMPYDEAPEEWELHTLEDLRWNDNHQCPIKYWSRDITKRIRWLMRQPGYVEHRIYAHPGCVTCDRL